MNILQIAPYFPPYLGGQERFVSDLSRQLVRMGHAVTVLTSRYPKDTPSQSEEDGIRVFRYRNLMRLLRNPISPGLLFSPQSIRQADVIHTHNEHSFASNAAMLLGRLFGKPVVLTVHGRLTMDSRIGECILTIYEKTISRMVFSAAAGITVPMPSERGRLVREFRIPEKQVTVIPVGIDLEYWDILRAVQPAAYAWQSGLKKKKVILIATQLIRRKGIDFLIHGMPRILSSEPDAILLIAGSGDEAANLHRLARSLNLENQIRFLGRIFDAELSAAYQAADVFVLPSLSEGLPLCIMEAWAHEKPVVTTRIDGTKECFAEVADLVAPSDTQALVESILGLLRDAERGVAKGNAGRKLMEKEYTWPVVAEKITVVYSEAIERIRLTK
jgi:glycosyltransferase involved in cell wall biosynthesis